mmetsp:Transcript_1833/g.2466  ORF Transcript_1833/g.2466 Transcript_1833/m.2466 type:complete len:310 (-) Transcript_1833:25-954(-)
MSELALSDQLQRSRLHVLYVVDDGKQHALLARRGRKTSFVNPPLLEVDAVQQSLQVDGLLPLLGVPLVARELVEVFIDLINLALLDDLLHEVIEEVHAFFLVVAQEVHLVWDPEHNGVYSILPFIEEELLVLLDVHQLVHNVQFHVHELAVDRVFARVVEMELHATSRELTLLLLLVLFEQIYHLGGHVVALVVQGHLILGARPQVLGDVAEVLLIRVVILFVVENHPLELLGLCALVVVQEFRFAPEQSNGRLLETLISHVPSLRLAPVFAMLTVAIGHEIFVLVIVTVGAIGRRGERTHWERTECDR